MARLRFFASAREAAGTGRDVVDGVTVADVLSAAVARYGAGFAVVLPTCRIWVNGEPADDDRRGGDRRSRGPPPVSGGQVRVHRPRRAPGAFASCLTSPRGEERLIDLGGFIRSQREVARISVRRLAELADVSNPYLSQIERGLRKPSAEILQQIAKALQISSESLYVRAGILDPEQDAEVSVVEAVHRDPFLDAGAEADPAARVREPAGRGRPCRGTVTAAEAAPMTPAHGVDGTRPAR